ncbi:MAG: hypothetical protein KDA20_06485 [Phycisphaerales bacterium]|nr:hypothetical protein [Phycisphaerales bacterium]
MNTLSFGLAVVACAGAASLAHAGGTLGTGFADHAAFTTFVESQGKFLKGVEDFEEAVVDDGAKLPFPNSLQSGVPRPGFDFGISATNLIIQTNITPNASPVEPNPSTNQAALWVNGAGFIGSNSIKVGTDEFLNGLYSSIDLIFTDDNKTAIGVDLGLYDGYTSGHAGWVITTYDPAGAIIDVFNLGPTSTEPSKSFFGVWSPVPIGRLNIWGIFDMPEPFAIDNIEMWTVPTPGALTLLGASGLVAMRRRR